MPAELSVIITNVMIMDQKVSEDELVPTAEAATLLGIHRVTAAALVRAGRLPALKVANRWLIRRSDLESFSRIYSGRRGRPPKDPAKKET